jgi:uncharacterized protein with PIN domain/sulfur carrier protein ThiS
MEQADFRFYGNLNDFLHESRKGNSLSMAFNSHQTVKHLIESLGVPHTEVARVLVNGKQVDFSYQARDGDQVDVYPPMHGAPGENLRGGQRFVLDSHLGRLAHYLRMLGFDILYRNDFDDNELAEISDLEDRILLTRDRRLLMRSRVERGYWLRSKIPREQLVEVVRRFGLNDQVDPFRRCIHCNGLLQPVSKERVLHRLEQLTKKYFEQFRICPECEHVYWKGSHYERMRMFIDQVMAEAGQ